MDQILEITFKNGRSGRSSSFLNFFHTVPLSFVAGKHTQDVREEYTEKPRIVGHEPGFDTYLYNGLFENESASEIVEAIKRVVETPVPLK